MLFVLRESRRQCFINGPTIGNDEWIAASGVERNIQIDFPLNQKKVTLTMTALESNQSNVCS